MVNCCRKNRSIICSLFYQLISGRNYRRGKLKFLQGIMGYLLKFKKLVVIYKYKAPIVNTNQENIKEFNEDSAINTNIFKKKYIQVFLQK